MSAAQTTALFDPQAIRPDFPILETKLPSGAPLIYFDSAASSQRPRQVIDALVEMYEKHYSNVHRGIHWLSDQSTDRYEEARHRVQKFINAADSSEVIFTHGTTESINLVARSWGDVHLAAGKEILLTVMEHHSNIVPWQQAAERTGATIRWIPLLEDGRLDLTNLDELLNENTAIVAVTAISNVLGTINPLAPIVQRARQVGAKVLVDAAQSVPHTAVDVQAIDADFLAFSGHKMMGPSGVGVLYGKRTLLEAMPPFLGGGSMIRRVKLDGFEPADLPARFEAGTPPIVSAIGLTAAIDYLEKIGLDAIHEHERQLTIRAHEVLEQVGAVRFLGPDPAHKAGSVSFTVDGVHAHDVAQLLDRHGIAVRAGHHCTMPLHKALGVNASTRASFYLYNTLEEVEKLGEAMREVKRVFRPRRRRR